jgi:hypothetical protein
LIFNKEVMGSEETGVGEGGSFSLDSQKHHLVVFAVDGLTTLSSTSRFMPYTHQMASKGLYAYQMRTSINIVNSDIPAWVSIFYASSSSVYGCDDNGCGGIPRMFDDMPTWLDILESEYDYAVTTFSQNKDFMDDILDRESFGSRIWTLEMLEQIQNHQFPNTPRKLTLIHFSGLERVAEVSGYNSFNYRAGVNCIDQQIATISYLLWEDNPESTTFMLVTDHGGFEYDHSKINLNNLQVPFMMWGDGVVSHPRLTGQSLETLQIGPTILSVLDMEDDIPSFWSEKPLMNVKATESKPSGITFNDIQNFGEIEIENCEIPYSIKHVHIVWANRIIFIVLFSLIVAGSLFFQHPLGLSLFNIK